MNFRFLYSFFFLFAFVGSYAQETTTEPKTLDLQDYQYKKEASGGLRVQTNGLSVFAEYGWIKDLNRTRLLQIEYTYYIDYRQKKTSSLLQGGRDYFFGMENRLNMIRFSYGIKRTIADKAKEKGVRLSFIAFGGVSLAILKPYYLDLLNDEDGRQVIKPERYSPSNASRFLSTDSIVEAAPVRYGLNQLQPVVGVQGKVGLDFDFGKKDEFVKAIECGAMLDAYYKRLPLMVNNSNRFYQVALFLSFQFGKRW